MNIRKMPLEDLELLSYTDIAYELLKSDKKSKTTPILFGEVCKLLEIDENMMFELIGDFYTTLTTDRRFILLENAEWDLKEFHVVKPVIDDDDDEEEVEIEDDEEVETEEDVVDEEDYDGDEDTDDLDDLAIVTEEELEE
ncbi:MAG: DNA-directed RNA polymerase subunit delta [Bacilli bacterium]